MKEKKLLINFDYEANHKEAEVFINGHHLEPVLKRYKK